MKLLGYPTNIDAYRAVRIENIEDDTSRVKTFTFRDELCRHAKPGQYIMLWVQGVDEIPLSLSAINHRGLSSVTVEKVGEATAALHSRKVGELVSLRGPYGNSFQPTEGNVFVVCGGCGLAPLLPLTEDLTKFGSEVTLIIGAKTRKEIISLTKVKPLLEKKGKLIITTEDGSYGLKGLATTPLEELLTKNTFTMVYTCGPELMMRRVFEISEDKKVRVQACFERIIRCSLGLCGSCVVGKFRVCKDGPIFSSEQLREVLDEFGRYKRNFDGSRVHF